MYDLDYLHIAFTGTLALPLLPRLAIQAGPVQGGAPAEGSALARVTNQSQEEIGAWHRGHLKLATLLRGPAVADNLGESSVELEVALQLVSRLRPAHPLHDKVLVLQHFGCNDRLHVGKVLALRGKIHVPNDILD